MLLGNRVKSAVGRVGGKKCHRQCAALGPKFESVLDWRNEVLHQLVSARRFPTASVVPVAKLLRPIAAAHKNTKWACTLDCTHYCYHPDLWAALLDGLYRRLLNWARQLPTRPTKGGRGGRGKRRGQRERDGNANGRTGGTGTTTTSV